MGTDHDFPACHPNSNAGCLAYAISFSPSHHHNARHQSCRPNRSRSAVRVRDISIRSSNNRPANYKAGPPSLSRNLARILLHPDVAGNGVFEREFDFVGGTETVVCP